MALRMCVYVCVMDVVVNGEGVEELCHALQSSMLLLNREDRFEPAVSSARWMSAAWVKMCSARCPWVSSTVH